MSEAEEIKLPPVRLALSPGLQTEIESLLQHKNELEIKEDDTKILEQVLDQGGLGSKDLAVILRLRKKKATSSGNSESKASPRKGLLGLLKVDKGKGGLIFPKLPEAKPNPELEKRRAWLIARQQRRDYDASVKNVRGKQPSQTMRESISEVRQTMRELSVGFMMILVCVAVFLALKMVADAQGRPPHVGLQWGLFGGSAMLFVEMILYAIRATRAETYSRQEKAFLDSQPTNISQFPILPRKTNNKSKSS
mmetsp:Transcript_2301/g.5306  ORF Transcript_2301/g.5306 Transcript_2301/m.5306 type:complete len:251 (+) Transcript_2301:322-1074(+)|eukprot:CAMPEP_0171488852 /NCGR_PEP_ID=MMETSP0958-20121227/2433_1 /TAXON_ID=87120 /ORGANISM="Aurantiochytrium limacinum, Strain ATCCMYA-1381" /LENGTH=250 /DNA_ID=CAMNT_0012022003 /DNA_START=242 /DNA_END=994 /DNA_ORIENTATION=-